jgi:type IV pilus assembly protein PilC
MFSSRLPLSSLIELCRVSRHYLSSGLSLLDVFRQQASRGPASVRPVAERIAQNLARGASLEEALQPEQRRFPPLFRALAEVGEQTGMLPEVFGQLERFYRRVQELRRQFLVRIAWPMTQFFLAIFVLAGLIFILGLLPVNTRPGGPSYDPLGLGLTGPSGAFLFLGVIFAAFLTLAGLYLLLTRAFGKSAAVHAFLLKLPAIGPCLRSLALARFSLALSLTTESGMSIRRALKLAFRATGNTAFVARSGAAEASVRAGQDLTSSLSQTHLFPGDFLRIVEVAEESGQLSESLQQQADHYHEESSRRLGFLTSLAGYGVWLFVGMVLIFVIFRLYLSYLSIFDQFI